MHAVLRTLGEYVAVAVRIVVRERHFGIVIEFFGSHLFPVSSGFEGIEDALHVAQRNLLDGGHLLKRVVAPVEARIEHGDQHSFALIVDAGRVVDTRAVNVDYVRRRLDGGNVVSFRVNDSLDARHLFDFRHVFVVHHQGYRVQQRGISMP